MTTAYKARAKKHPDGGYELSFGRGQKKLTARLQKWDQPATNGDLWHTDEPKLSASTKKEVQADWQDWAERNYDPPPPPEPKKSKPPSLTARKGPPPLRKQPRKGGPPAFQASQAPAKGADRPNHPAYDAERSDLDCGDDNPYLADPFQPGMFDEGRKFLTSEGVLDEVYRWMQEHIPFKSQMEYPWVRVRKHLMRQFPDELRYRETP